MYRKLLLCLCLSLLPPVSRAADAPTPTSSLANHPGEAALLFEGITFFNSALAAANPQDTGAVILLTTPLALAEDRDHGAQLWVGASGYAAIGVFDASQPPGYSHKQVFAQNFVIWNLWGGTMLLIAHGSSDGPVAKLAQHVSMTPQLHGGVRVDYRWSF